MNSCPKIVYPRARKVKNVKHMLSMKVKLKKDSSQVKVNESVKNTHASIFLLLSLS